MQPRVPAVVNLTMQMFLKESVLILFCPLKKFGVTQRVNLFTKYGQIQSRINHNVKIGHVYFNTH